MPEILEIRRNSDGVVRSTDEEWDTDPDAATEYLWSEGNYSCDCNRALFFARAAGENDPEYVDCGETAYSVRVKAADGRVLYEDGEGWQ